MLLVGRSGTGKTSIAIGRMFATYSQWCQSLQGALFARKAVGGERVEAATAGGQEMMVAAAREDETLRYHQLFVTASRVLRDQVRARERRDKT